MNQHQERKKRIEYIARTTVSVLESVNEFLSVIDLSEDEKMDVFGTDICEMAREMSRSDAGMRNLAYVMDDMSNSIQNSPVLKAQWMTQ